MFTDFSLCQKTGNLSDDLARFPFNNDLLPLILVANPKDEDLLYPQVETVRYPISRYRSLVQSYINRIHEIYTGYYKLTELDKSRIGIIYIVIMKEYAKMAKELSEGREILYPAHQTPYKYEKVSEYLLKDRIIPDQRELITTIMSLPTPQSYDVPYISSYLQKIWASTTLVPDKSENIDNFILLLKYRSYLRTSQALFSEISIPGTKFDVSAKQVQLDSLLSGLQKSLVQKPEKDARYQAMFLMDLDLPELYQLAADPLMHIK
jgi:hypothetical protein